jgi:hypothetical protein
MHFHTPLSFTQNLPCLTTKYDALTYDGVGIASGIEFCEIPLIGVDPAVATAVKDGSLATS